MLIRFAPLVTAIIPTESGLSRTKPAVALGRWSEQQHTRSCAKSCGPHRFPALQPGNVLPYPGDNRGIGCAVTVGAWAVVADDHSARPLGSTRPPAGSKQY